MSHSKVLSDLSVWCQMCKPQETCDQMPDRPGICKYQARAAATNCESFTKPIGHAQVVELSGDYDEKQENEDKQEHPAVRLVASTPSLLVQAHQEEAAQKAEEEAALPKGSAVSQLFRSPGAEAGEAGGGAGGWRCR